MERGSMRMIRGIMMVFRGIARADGVKRQRVLAKREGREVAFEGEQHSNERVPAGLRNVQGGERVYTLAAGREKGGPPQAQVGAAREPEDILVNMQREGVVLVGKAHRGV
jgi:hypothetical protein